MSSDDVAIFEAVALRFLIDLFPEVEGLSIDFIFVDVVKQELNGTRRLSEIQDRVNFGILSIDMLVTADLLPGDPVNFNFQFEVETFFDLKFGMLLDRLRSQINFFKPSRVQQSGGGNSNTPVAANGGSFFTLPLICGLAVATVAAIAIVTLLVRRRDERNERLHSQISGTFNGNEFYSGIKPRDYDDGSMSADPSKFVDCVSILIFSVSDGKLPYLF